ncbi:hypothetical protein E3N88_29556 [Mikania micrantha]|uniref:Uncharacterized protein n=1 Tax=Mikania micrantha TaxID=192012 RepID=A0A5N6MJJ4_9ASTR|nr:hypothetical protein E3N88_29556 [Mikania micrantha]
MDVAASYLMNGVSVSVSALSRSELPSWLPEGFTPGRGLLLTVDTTTRSSGCGKFVFLFLPGKIRVFGFKFVFSAPAATMVEYMEIVCCINEKNTPLLRLGDKGQVQIESQCYHLVNLLMGEAFVSNSFDFAVLEDEGIILSLGISSTKGNLHKLKPLAMCLILHWDFVAKSRWMRYKTRSIRLDSGDLAYVSCETRKFF